MERVNNIFVRERSKILYTIVVIILLFVVLISMISHIYSFSEREAFEKLHLETQQIKSEINLQMLSDRENLLTMANFAAKLHSEGKELSLLFESYKEIGLIENIGILLPDNSMVTKSGILDVEGLISFDEEKTKGAYISGRVKDITQPERDTVRSAVPIVAGNETVGILYGLLNPEKIEKRYAEAVKNLEADLYVFEGRSGNYLVDTKRDTLGNISMLAGAEYNHNYTYEQIADGISKNKHGFSAFKSLISNENVYVHYAPLDFSDWYIMLVKSETVVFAEADSTGNYMILIFILVILLMGIYILLLFDAERKELKTSVAASKIRKRLLTINFNKDSFDDALKTMTSFVSADSSFFVDNNGEYFSYINHTNQKNSILTEERTYFTNKLLNYASKRRDERATAVYIFTLNQGNQLKNTEPELYDFFVSHDIKSVNYAVVVNNDTVSLLGSINSSKKSVILLLKDIAVCFSMAVFNRKHLDNTEAMALTDSLTNIKNRMAYRNDIKELEEDKYKFMSCIYVDVNELHTYNNKYGHSAGDQMLVFVAEVLKKEFGDKYLYRMGGDEYLVFAEDLTEEEIKQKLANAISEIEEMKYHISFGVYSGKNADNIASMVNKAEKLMYEDKARYYQQKDKEGTWKNKEYTVERKSSGIEEIDAALSVMSRRYVGVYYVSLDKDEVSPVLIPTYLKHIYENSNSFKEAFSKYIYSMVHNDYHRPLSNFMEYDALKQQLKEGYIPRIAYENINGERFVLSVHTLPTNHHMEKDTVWIFEKDAMENDKR